MGAQDVDSKERLDVALRPGESFSETNDERAVSRVVSRPFQEPWARSCFGGGTDLVSERHDPSPPTLWLTRRPICIAHFACDPAIPVAYVALQPGS